MKTGIFITARLGSTRLARKHLLPVNDKPLIYYLIERIRQEFSPEIQKGDVRIAIVTSDEPENRKFEDFTQRDVSVFYGSIHNIPLRHHKAATAYTLDGVISVDGDDILCSPTGMRAIYRALVGGTEYVKTSNLPFGMNSSGYAAAFLAASIKHHSDDILETGWGRIFDEKKLADISMPFFTRNDSLRFTLDYEADYQFFKAVIERCGDGITRISDKDIIDVVLKGELFEINESIAKQYWDNFYRQQTAEKERSTIHARSGHNEE